MLLDFSDLAEDASGKGMLSLLVFLLRELQDFPINLLSVCLKEYPMSTIFGPKLAHNALRGGFALGLVFATVWTTFWLLFSVMQEQGWIFLLRIANSRGWHLTYNAAAQTILYFSSLILGALLAGVLLAMFFREARQVKRYLLASLLGWVAPFALIRILGLFLKDNAIFLQSGTVIIGLGIGTLFSVILRDHKRTPWILLVGVIGYYLAHTLGITFLLPLAPDNNAGLFNWSEIVFVAIFYGVEGTMIGMLLGGVSGRSRPQAASSSVI